MRQNGIALGDFCDIHTKEGADDEGVPGFESDGAAGSPGHFEAFFQIGTR